MTKILLTGASGFVGQGILPLLERYKIVAIGRNLSKLPKDVEFHYKDITPEQNYFDVLDGIDSIIHLAARVHVMEDYEKSPIEAYREVNTHGTVNLAKQAAYKGVRRFIYISTVKVNGESTRLNPFTADQTPNPSDPYGISKYEAEQKLIKLAEKSSMEIVIIRPPLIYGPGVKANFLSLLNLVGKNIPLPFKRIDNKRSLVALDNLGSLIECCIQNPRAANKIFMVSDDNDLSTAELVEQIALQNGKHSNLFSFPIQGLKLVAKIFKKERQLERLTDSLQVDITQTKVQLDWRPVVTMQQQLTKMMMK